MREIFSIGAVCSCGHGEENVDQTNKLSCCNERDTESEREKKEKKTEKEKENEKREEDRERQERHKERKTDENPSLTSHRYLDLLVKRPGSCLTI